MKLLDINIYILLIKSIKDLYNVVSGSEQILKT